MRCIRLRWWCRHSLWPMMTINHQNVNSSQWLSEKAFSAAQVIYSDFALDEYRSNTHDAFLIYGFTLQNSLSGLIQIISVNNSAKNNLGELKFKMDILDGISNWSEWGECLGICGEQFSQSRTRTCSYPPMDGTTIVTEQMQDCDIHSGMYHLCYFFNLKLVTVMRLMALVYHKTEILWNRRNIFLVSSSERACPKTFESWK